MVSATGLVVSSLATKHPQAVTERAVRSHPPVEVVPVVVVCFQPFTMWITFEFGGLFG